jgi:hypothetical protein
MLGGFVVLGIGGLMGANCSPDVNDPSPGDIDRGARLFAEGDGIGPSCQSCHCPDAAGGCRLEAPNIQGRSFALIDARTRDPDVFHPGGKFSFTTQDIADLESFLGSYVDP